MHLGRRRVLSTVHPGRSLLSEPRTPGSNDTASREEVAALIVYFAAVVLLTDALNIRAGIELLTLVVVVAAVLISRRPFEFLRDWWFLLIGLVLWNLSGPVAARSPYPHHLSVLLHIDDWLFFGHDPVASLQHHFARHGHVGPLDWLTAAVYNLHLPEPYIVGFMLWRTNRPVYFQFAAASLLLLVAGFVTFIFFPAVPPWMSSMMYDTPAKVYNGFGPVLHSHPLPFHGTPIFYFWHLTGDAEAAFPSEHAAFPVLEYLAFLRAYGRAGHAMLLWVLCVLFSIVYLGEHWVTDALAGYAYALVIWSGVLLFTLGPPREIRPPRLVEQMLMHLH